MTWKALLGLALACAQAPALAAGPARPVKLFPIVLSEAPRNEGYVSAVPGPLPYGQAPRLTSVCPLGGLNRPPAFRPEIGLGPSVSRGVLAVPGSLPSITPQPRSVSLILSWSQRNADPQPSAPSEAGAASFQDLFENAGRGESDTAPLAPFEIGGDGEEVYARLVLRLNDPREADLARKRDALRALAQKAKPALEESVREGDWNGPGTNLESRCCGDAAPKLGFMLRQRGVPARLVEAEFHYYLIVDLPEGQIVIDPTIRQFFGGPRAPPGVPAVFVGTIPDLNALFAAHASAKTTRYDMRRIYFNGSAVRDSKLAALQEAILSQPRRPEYLSLLRYVAGISAH